MSVDVFVNFPLCSSKLWGDVCQCLGVEVYLKTMNHGICEFIFCWHLQFSFIITEQSADPRTFSVTFKILCINLHLSKSSCVLYKDSLPLLSYFSNCETNEQSEHVYRKFRILMDSGLKCLFLFIQPYWICVHVHMWVI